MRRWLWVIALGIRLVAALVLLFGPWTDSAEDLEGWDADRFQAIADAPGRHWVDHAVEYPPGTVVLVEAIAGDDLVSTHRSLVLLSLAIDTGIALCLQRYGPKDAGLAYLLLGLPLVPVGLLRLDLWAAGLAGLGLLALQRRRTAAFALAAAVGAAIKIVPGLLLPVALASGRRREAVAGTGLSFVLIIAWLSYGGWGALEQVLSIRNVTGWHLESVPGSIVALFTDESPRLEADAFRIGTVDAGLVLTGRLVTVTVIVVLGWFTHRGPASLERMALMLLGTSAALIVTAPLLSPQFLLWLTPAAALLWASPSRVPVWLTAAAIILTAGTLAVFGPPNLHHPLAAALLLARDAILVTIVIATGVLLSGSADRGAAAQHSVNLQE